MVDSKMNEFSLKPYIKLLSETVLFEGFSTEEMTRALELFSARTESYRKDELLQESFCAPSYFGLLLEGSVLACADDFEGNRLILNQVSPGITFGEALCFLKKSDSPVYILAAKDSKVLWLRPDMIFGDGADAMGRLLQERFAKLLAGRTLAMNDRIQVLSKLTIREKLITYFSELTAARGLDTVTVPFGRTDMASFIGADRSAMGRELARMKKEGIIDYSGRTFTVKKT